MRAPPVTLKRARRLRRSMTPPEALLWVVLRDLRDRGVVFRRQHPIGPYILDFYCPAARLAVEVDGEGHAEAAQAQHDAVRDAWLARQGIEVLRLGAAEVFDPEARAGVVEGVVRRTARILR